MRSEEVKKFPDRVECRIKINKTFFFFNRDGGRL